MYTVFKISQNHVLILSCVKASSFNLVRNNFFNYLHFSSSAWYGYVFSVSIPPLFLMYLKAKSISPPLQPSFPYFFEQSIKFCSLNDTNLPVDRKCCPSNAPVYKGTKNLIKESISKELNPIFSLKFFFFFMFCDLVGKKRFTFINCRFKKET